MDSNVNLFYICHIICMYINTVLNQRHLNIYFRIRFGLVNSIDTWKRLVWCGGDLLALNTYELNSTYKIFLRMI